jgi:cyanophycinase
MTLRRIIEDGRIKKSCLFVAGGNISNNKRRIYQKFVALSGGTTLAKIAVIPSSSAFPVDTFLEFKRDLLEFTALKKEQIVLVKLAVRSDPTTKEDESLWAHNANNLDEVKKVKDATGIWFTGGNQHRTTTVLRNKDGSNTLMLDALYALFEAGYSCLAGTSAGAALMSEIMIGGGTSYDALSDKRVIQIDGYGDDITHDNFIINRKGLGFFKYGIIDQHFDARDRVGRLLEGCFNEGEKALGFGISEDTAFLYNRDTEEMSIVGNGGVFIIDPKNAISKELKNLSVYKNVVISYIIEGMKYDLVNKTIVLNEDFRETPPKNTYSPSFMKCFNRSDEIFGFVDDYLLLNKNELNIKDRYKRPFIIVSAFQNTKNESEYYELRFIQQSSTKRYLNMQTNKYAFINLLMEIHPWKEFR